ncbi:hypothetical protein ANN_23809 [Periplaneta americana]|uniref:Uncharacterized protein n=1 Tax=Periplaneta americana TaxID=6978 RepID=A0ABQ8SNC8_PERAM|nr:hypothetical protein ANN_23809 [Periplaneta americana]
MAGLSKPHIADVERLMSSDTSLKSTKRARMSAESENLFTITCHLWLNGIVGKQYCSSCGSVNEVPAIVRSCHKSRYFTDIFSHAKKYQGESSHQDAMDMELEDEDVELGNISENPTKKAIQKRFEPNFKRSLGSVQQDYTDGL